MKPSAGAMRIAKYVNSAFSDPCEGVYVAEGVDAEVRPLVEALEAFAALDDIDPSTADRARAALKAWKGEGE